MMKSVLPSDVWPSEEFEGQYWFFQLIVWLDFLADPLPNTVIETGTYRGSGAYRWSKFFDTVHTVELSEELYLDNLKKYGHINSINFHMGSSIEFLTEFLPTMDDRCIIMLDAHGSGQDTTFDESVGRYGSPVIGELLAIKENSIRNDHVIIIDDTDDFDSEIVYDDGKTNYPTKSQVRDAVLEINPNYCVELDIPKNLLLSRGTGLIYLPEG
tara:strand:- start:4919 stop:5557 length:639 start_codon:yes stop_codon:yes gene_type:complete